MNNPRFTNSRKTNSKPNNKTPLKSKQQSNYNSKKKFSATKTKNKSPKTIDYSKLMEKYGNIVDNSFTLPQNNNQTKNQKNNKTRKIIYDETRTFKTITPAYNDYQYFDMNDDTNYSPDKCTIRHDITEPNNDISNYPPKRCHHKSSIDINHYPIKKNFNVVVDRYNDSNNNNYKHNNNQEIEKLNKEIQDLKTENNKLKLNVIDTNNNKEHNLKDKNYIIEKIFLLLNLCRKYAKKFNRLYPLFELNFKNKNELNQNNNNDEILQELKNTIVQYNNMVFNKKISNLFQIEQENEEGYSDIKYNTILNTLDISELEPKSINFSEKYKAMMKNLKKENSEMKIKLHAYNKKVEKFKKEKYEYEKKIKLTFNENNELKDKIKVLEIQYNDDKNIIDKQKSQIEILIKDVKFKENMISYLQSLLSKLKINPNLFNSESISKNFDLCFKSNNNNSNIISNDTFKNFTKDENKNINRYRNNGIANNEISFNITSPDKLDNNQVSTKKVIDENLISPYDGKYDNITSDEKEEMTNENVFKNSEMSNSKSNSDIISINKKENIIIENNENKDEEKPKLNSEIEQLDKEILNLKHKLKNMINK